MMNSYIFPLFLVVLTIVSAQILRHYCHKKILRNFAMVGFVLGVALQISCPIEFFCRCEIWYHHFLNLLLSWFLCWGLLYLLGKVRK